MAVSKKKVEKKSAKKVAPKVKAKDYYYVVLNWSGINNGGGTVSRVHHQDKGTPFNIFQATLAVQEYLAHHVGQAISAVLTNFISITKNEADLYAAELAMDSERRLAAAKVQAEKNKIAEEEAAASKIEEVVETEAEVIPMHRDVDEVAQG